MDKNIIIKEPSVRVNFVKNRRYSLEDIVKIAPEYKNYNVIVNDFYENPLGIFKDYNYARKYINIYLEDDSVSSDQVFESLFYRGDGIFKVRTMDRCGNYLFNCTLRFIAVKQE